MLLGVFAAVGPPARLGARGQAEDQGGLLPSRSPLSQGPTPNSVGFLLSPRLVHCLGSLPRQGSVLRLITLSAGFGEANLVRSQGQEDKNHDRCQGDGDHKKR